MPRLVRRPADLPTSGRRVLVVVDEHREAMEQISALLRARGQLPVEVASTVEALQTAWSAGVPDKALLAGAKEHLWSDITDKHGDSVTITDAEDRTVRAALCLAEGPGDSWPGDLLDWADQMLAP